MSKESVVLIVLGVLLGFAAAFVPLTMRVNALETQLHPPPKTVTLTSEGNGWFDKRGREWGRTGYEKGISEEDGD